MTATMALRAVSDRTRAGGQRARRGVRRILMIVALPAVLVGVWWLTSAQSTNYLNPPLSMIVAQFWPTWFGGGSFADTRFAKDVVPSVLRVLAGYGIAVVVGVVLGVVIGTWRGLRALLEPVLEFFRAIPPPVLVPVFMLFLGIGSEMKIAVIAIGCVWPILLNTVEGVRGIDPVLRDTARAFRMTPRGRLFRLVLPAASPQIVTGARQALSIGIILMVISEMFAARDGLGFTIVQFQRSFAIPQMWGGVILLGVMGVVLAAVFRIIADRVLSWYRGYLQSQRGGS